MCTNRETYQNHVKTCSSRNCYATAGNTLLQFRNWKARRFLPFLLCFDRESYLVPTATAQPSTSTSYTVAIEKHELCGNAIAAREHGEATPVYFELKRGGKCLNEFVESSNVLARDI